MVNAPPGLTSVAGTPAIPTGLLPTTSANVNATQVRMVAPITGVTNVPRPPQPIVQQRMVKIKI